MLVSGRQNSKLFGRNDPYGIIDTRQAVGYDKGKEGRGNELSPAGQGWAQPNQTKPGTPNAYAEYLAYKEKVQARQQRLALEQALQQLLVQEQAASAVAGPQAVAYNGADAFASGGYETGGTAGSGGAGGAGTDSVLPAAGTGEATGQVLREGDSKTDEYVKIEGKGSTGRTTPNDLVEEMAMDSTKKNPFDPGEGNTVRKVIDSLNDTRWNGWEKWEIVYRTDSGRTITIHFSYDPVNNLFDDFKFKY